MLDPVPSPKAVNGGATGECGGSPRECQGSPVWCDCLKKINFIIIVNLFISIMYILLL